MYAGQFRNDIFKSPEEEREILRIVDQTERMTE
jgi:hypothetical protein